MIMPIDLDCYGNYRMVYLTSKGDLPKWFVNDHWYKVDYFGYESLSEFIASKLLEKSNISEYCSYGLTKALYKGKIIPCSISPEFRSDTIHEVITLYKLLKCSTDINKLFGKGRATKDIIADIVTLVESEYGVQDFSSYLTKLIEFDAFILNEDRHLNNIAFLYCGEDKLRLCPVFDNGLSLCADVSDYEICSPTTVCIKSVKSKPFCSSFTKQVKAVRELYGSQLRFCFNIEYIDEICDEALEFYNPVYVNRVRAILKIQMRRYPELFDSNNDAVGLEKTSMFEQL